MNKPAPISLWTQLDNETRVMRVPGGMVIQTYEFCPVEGGDGIQMERQQSEALCFVPCSDSARNHFIKKWAPNEVVEANPQGETKAV